MKNEEKTPLGVNKKGIVFGSRNTVQWEDFVGTSEALNAQQVNFNCMERKKGRMIFEMPMSDDHVPEHKTRGWR